MIVQFSEWKKNPKRKFHFQNICRICNSFCVCVFIIFLSFFCNFMPLINDVISCVVCFFIYLFVNRCFHSWAQTKSQFMCACVFKQFSEMTIHCMAMDVWYMYYKFSSVFFVCYSRPFNVFFSRFFIQSNKIYLCSLNKIIL